MASRAIEREHPAHSAAVIEKIAILPAYEAAFPLLHMLCDTGERMRVLIEYDLENVEAVAQAGTIDLFKG